MAAPIQSTSEGSAEGAVDSSGIDVDYAELLRVQLRQKKLMYIADIILEVEGLHLEDLMKWSRDDLAELVKEIHDDDGNQHKIKVTHRNKFADLVLEMAAKQRESATAAQAPPSAPTAGVKLLFLGKDEEEAIEDIQSGQQFMLNNAAKLKQQFAALEQNTNAVKQSVESICNELKQRIDEKQKEVMRSVELIHAYHLSKLNQRNHTTQQSAKVVSKFYSDYEGWFRDIKLTKSERKEKLVAAKESIQTEVEKIRAFKDAKYEMQAVLNENVADQFFRECLELTEIGMELPPITGIQIDGNIVTWDASRVADQVLTMLKNDKSNNAEDVDQKEHVQTNVADIKYEFVHREICDDNESKEDADWKVVRLGTVSNYDLAPFVKTQQFHIQYTINSLLRSPPSEMQKYAWRYTARWSAQHKGNRIQLSDGNKKALMAKEDDQCVRAEFPIPSGVIVQLKFTVFYESRVYYEMLGVISSEFENFTSVETPAQDSTITKYAYGLHGHSGSEQYYGGQKDLGWSTGKIPTGQEVTICMTVDTKSYDSCCLSFHHDGQLLGPSNSTYSMKLPKLSQGHVWYPMTCFDFTNNWCKIECIN